MSVFNILTTVVSVVAIFFKIQFLLFELFVFYFFFFYLSYIKKEKKKKKKKNSCHLFIIGRRWYKPGEGTIFFTGTTIVSCQQRG